MTRAALYARVSTVDQHPESQLLDLQQLAIHRGWRSRRPTSITVFLARAPAGRHSTA